MVVQEFRKFQDITVLFDNLSTTKDLTKNPRRSNIQCMEKKNLRGTSGVGGRMTWSEFERRRM
ncbi:hypothetical protein PanWU01x14_154380 [Parasponia andersonii]|uniref:Uncharacterized protein n=1 Tax=Parasponia andersonii TaxID=3476 RepID=A0A2P5CGT7_PARAD|nr:hypothetical protein PanWU01x14_154380 [Parasponia andersonii]